MKPIALERPMKTNSAAYSSERLNAFRNMDLELVTDPERLDLRCKHQALDSNLMPPTPFNWRQRFASFVNTELKKSNDAYSSTRVTVERRDAIVHITTNAEIKWHHVCESERLIISNSRTKNVDFAIYIIPPKNPQDDNISNILTFKTPNLAYNLLRNFDTVYSVNPKITSLHNSSIPKNVKKYFVISLIEEKHPVRSCCTCQNNKMETTR